MDVEFTNVFNPEVVDNDPKNNCAPCVAPESRGCGGFIVPIFVEADTEKIICQFDILWKGVASLEDFEIDPSIVGVFDEVVFIYELLKNI